MRSFFAKQYLMNGLLPVARDVWVGPVLQEDLHALVLLLVHGNGQEGVTLTRVDCIQPMVDPVTGWKVVTVNLDLCRKLSPVILISSQYFLILC